MAQRFRRTLRFLGRIENGLSKNLVDSHEGFSIPLALKLSRSALYLHSKLFVLVRTQQFSGQGQLVRFDLILTADPRVHSRKAANRICTWPNKQAGPLFVAGDETSLDGIDDGVGNAIDDRRPVDGLDRCEAPLDHLAARPVNLVEEFSQRPLEPAHEVRQLARVVPEHEMDVIGHLGDTEQANSRTGAKRLRQKESYSFCPARVRTQAKFRSDTPKGDRPPSTRAQSSRLTHIEPERRQGAGQSHPLSSGGSSSRISTAGDECRCEFEPPPLRITFATHPAQKGGT